MYYKIISDLSDKMKVYKETPLDKEHPAYGIERRQLRSPWSRDYFTIENGNIILISGRPDKKEFDGVKIEYPKGSKEISLFIEKNKESLFSMSEDVFMRDYKINLHRNNLLGELMGIDMTIEDFRPIMETPPTSQQKKVMNRLWNERDRIIRDISKLDKKEQLLLSGKSKKKNNSMER